MKEKKKRERRAFFQLHKFYPHSCSLLEMCGLCEGAPSDHPVMWWHLIHSLTVECKVAPQHIFFQWQIGWLNFHKEIISSQDHGLSLEPQNHSNGIIFFTQRVSDMYSWPLCLACPLRGNITRQVTHLVMIPETECLPTCIWKALCTDMTSLLPAYIWVWVRALWLGDTNTFYILDMWSWVSPWTSALR